MRTYIALLRGINVSGHKKIKMADFRDLLSKAGFENVQTYIQSGNILFDSSEKDMKILEKDIYKVIKDAYGFNVPVLVMNHSYLESIIENNPFLSENPDLDIKKLCVTFLSVKPSEKAKSTFNNIDYPPDRFIFRKQEIYGYYPNGQAKTKLTNTLYERKLKVAATTRNWRTVNKLFEMSQQ